MICIHCGKAIPDGAARCDFCGGESEYLLRFSYQPSEVPHTPPAVFEPGEGAEPLPSEEMEAPGFEELTPETPASADPEDELFPDPAEALESLRAGLKKVTDFIQNKIREKRGKR